MSVCCTAPCTQEEILSQAAQPPASKSNPQSRSCAGTGTDVTAHAVRYRFNLTKQCNISCNKMTALLMTSTFPLRSERRTSRGVLKCVMKSCRSAGPHGSWDVGFCGLFSTKHSQLFAGTEGSCSVTGLQKSIHGW